MMFRKFGFLLGALLLFSVGMFPAQADFTGAVPSNAPQFGIRCDGTTDDGPAIQSALAALQGAPLILPTGTCVVATEINAQTAPSGAFGYAPTIIGQGRNSTILDNRVANGPMMLLGSSADKHFQIGGMITQLQVTNSTNAAASTDFQVQRVGYQTFSHLWLNGVSKNGIQIDNNNADADSSFTIVIDDIRGDNLKGWAIYAVGCSVVAGSCLAASNEISNLTIENSEFQNSGTASNSLPPTSGAIAWKGQIGLIENTSATLSNNVALFVPGGSGGARNLTLDNIDFENTQGATNGVHVRVNGIVQMYAWNIQCLGNNSFQQTGCLYVDGTSSAVSQIYWNNTTLRATSGENSYTAFTITGANADQNTIQVTNTFYADFDYSGQTRFAGFVFPAIRGSANFSPTTTNVVGLQGTGFGNVIPLHLAANGGEWVPYYVTSLIQAGITGGVSTLEYCYANATGTIPLSIGITCNTTAPTTDSTSGYEVETGNSLYTYLGSVRTDSSGNFGTLSYSTSQFAPNATQQAESALGGAAWWARFDGKTAAQCTLKDSFNVASCTRNGTGDYTVTFTTPMLDANYAVTGSGTQTGTGVGVINITATGSLTTASARVLCLNLSASAQDCDIVSVFGYGPQ